jgi:phospholipid/cholesterol/gamma-HCH transport system permease protein
MSAKRKVGVGSGIIVAFSSFFQEAGSLTAFAGSFFRAIFKKPFEFDETIKQCYLIGYRSLGLVAITAFILGLVMTIQTRPGLADLGAESLLPSMVSISIIREIGPVITALICAGKVGSGIGAEISSMRVTEQIDAMEVAGIKPFKYIVSTRIIAATFMVPVLVFYADGIALIGSYIGINLKDNVSFPLYFHQALSYLTFLDVFPAFIKSFVFGFAIGLVGCYKGYNSNSGTAGVGKAANSSVVLASLLVFIIDMIAVQITDLFYT